MLLLIYNLGAGVDQHLVEHILDPSFLDCIANTFKHLQSIIKNSQASAWVGESGGAYNSGIWISLVWLQLMIQRRTDRWKLWFGYYIIVLHVLVRSQFGAEHYLYLICSVVFWN